MENWAAGRYQNGTMEGTVLANARILGGLGVIDQLVTRLEGEME